MGKNELAEVKIKLAEAQFKETRELEDTGRYQIMKGAYESNFLKFDTSTGKTWHSEAKFPLKDGVQKFAGWKEVKELE